MTREQAIAKAASAVDDATSAVLTDHIVQQAAEEALEAVGFFQILEALNRSGEAIASLPSDALGIGINGSPDDETATCWSLRDELLDQIARAQGARS